MNQDWRKQHGEIISDFLHVLNEKTNTYILKGGTALMMCYNLDRFSEDIDLDSTGGKNIKKIIESYCINNGYTYRIAKDTDTVQRFMLSYGNEQKPLKIEISYRNKNIKPSSYTTINNIKVYTIENLCLMKSTAYNARDKIRDLYDITYICNNYWDELSDNVKDVVTMNIEYKGLEQFDYLISTQKDELIDNDKLSNDFLELYDRLGLMIDSEELENSTINAKYNVKEIEDNQDQNFEIEM